MIWLDAAGDHGWAWNGYYLATVTGSFKEDLNGNGTLDGMEADLDGDGKPTADAPPGTSFDLKSTGYAFSRLARQQAGDAAIERPAGNFYDAGQGHEHTPSLLVLRDFMGNEQRNPDGSFRPNEQALSSVGLAASDLVYARWTPQWKSDQMPNGGLSYGGDENDGQSGLDSNLVPGWSHHGGGGPAHVVSHDTGFAIELTPGARHRTSNRFYVPPGIGKVQFSYEVVTPTQGQTIPAELRAQVQTEDGKEFVWHSQPFSVAAAGSFADRTLEIPLGQRNRVNKLSFALVPAGLPVDATVRIHSIRLLDEKQFSGRTGDIIVVQLKDLHPQAATFKALGFELFTAGLSNESALEVNVIEKRDDWTLHPKPDSPANPPPGLLGTVLFSHRLDSTNEADSEHPFSRRGLVYFAPGTADGLWGDAAPGSPGFQGFLKFKYLVDGASRSVLIEVKPGSTEREDELLAVGQIDEAYSLVRNIRVQHRLNYLGFPDYEGLPLAVDGILGPRTASAISLFRAAVDPTGQSTPLDPQLDVSYNVNTQQAQGEIDDVILAWLNSAQSPRWQQALRPLASLSQALNQAAGATTLHVDSAGGLPAAPFTIRIGGELLTVNSVSGTALTVIRGIQGTSAAAHPQGAAVLLTPEHGYGTNWLFDALADAGVILRDAAGTVTDLSRVLVASPRRGDGSGFSPGHADSNPNDAFAEDLHRNGLQADVNLAGFTPDAGKTPAQTLQDRLTASGRIRGAEVRQVSGTMHHVTVLPPRLLAFTERQAELLQRGLQALRGKLSELGSTGDLNKPLPLVGPTGVTADETEQVRLGEALQVKRTVEAAFDLLLAHLAGTETPTVDTLERLLSVKNQAGEFVSTGVLEEALAGTGITLKDVQLEALQADGLHREFKLALQTETRLTRELNLGTDALAAGIVLQPDVEQVASATTIGQVVSSWQWNLVNTPHIGDDIRITLRDGATVDVSFDGIFAHHTLQDVVTRINDAIVAKFGSLDRLQAQLDVNRIVLTDNTPQLYRIAQLQVTQAPPAVIVPGQPPLVSLSGELLKLLGADDDGDGILRSGRYFAATPLWHINPEWDRVHRELYTVGSPGPDLQITLRNGAVVSVSWASISSRHALTDVLNQIHEAAQATSGAQGLLEVDAQDGRIVLRDLSEGTGTLHVAGSPLAVLLKLTGPGATVSGGVFTGGSLVPLVDVTNTLDLEVSFRMNLALDASPSERFTARLESLTATADIDPHSPPGDGSPPAGDQIPTSLAVSAGMFDLTAGFDSAHRARVDLQLTIDGTPLGTDPWSLTQLRTWPISSLVGVGLSETASSVDNPATPDVLEVVQLPVRANLGECCQLGVSVRDDRIVLREQNTGSNGTGLAVTAINGSPVAALLNLVADDDPANPNAGNYDGVIRTDLLGVPATLVEVASNWNAVNAHAGPDIEITLRDGTIVPVTFDGLNQTGSVEAALNRIRTAAGAAGKLEVTFENKRIRLRDLTAGGGPLQVKAKGGSSVGETLGLLGSDTDGDGVLLGGVLNDVTASTPLGRLVPTWDTVNVHAGPDIRVTLRDGATQFVVRFDGLSASHTLGDLLDRIRDAAPRTASDLDLGSIRLTVPGGQVFSDSPLLVDMTHPMILAFSPGGYLAGLEMIESWLAELQTTALFQTPLPLTGGSKLSDFVKFDEVFHATVVQPIEELIDANRFRTFGDLTLVNGPLTVTCVRVDLPNKQLLFDIQTDLWPAPVTAALGLAGGFGSLSGLSTASTVTVESQVQGEFTLGFDLNAVGSPGGQSFSPAAGTLLSSLNGGAGVEGVTKNPPTGSAPDVKVALSDGTTFQAAFSGLTTLGQVIAALNTAAAGVGAAGKFQAKISDTPLEAGIELIDKSGGLDGTFKVTALNRSFTENGKTVTKLSRAGLPGVGLGILGSVSEPDENGQRILRGAALHGDSVANHVYLLSSGDDRPEFHATVNLTASDIDATGQLGPAQVQIENGIGSGRLALDFQLRDPNTVPGTQGKITVTELVKSLNSLAQPHDPNTSLLDVDRLDGKAVLTLPATAKLVPATPGGTVLQDSGTINVAWDPVFKKVETGTSPSGNLKQVKFVPATENAKVTVTGFDKLKKLLNLSPSTIADALALVGQYLDSLLGNGNNLLGKKIPGLEENMADLIDVDTALANAAKILKSKAVSTLGTLEEVLETEIEKAVGLPVTNGQDSSVVEISLDEIDGTALKIELHLPVDLAAKSSLDADPAKTGLQLPLSLNLLGKGLGSGSPLSDSDGAALMDVTAGAVFHVGLGLDLSNPTAPRPFLYGGNDPGDTRATVSVRAQAGGLNFNASVGPLGLFVKNGSFVLDQDGDGAGTGPATFTAGLSEGRHYLSNPGGLALQTNVSLVGGVHGALPVFFPTEAAKHRLSPDVGVEIDNLAAFLASPTDNVFTVPDLQQAVNNMNFADGMSGFAAGWDGVFQVLETVVDNQVFVTKIPLIGDQLVDASRFLLDLRRRVSDNLQQAGGKTLVFVQQKLYEALGEGGLNWLQDRNGDGAITKADVGVLADGIDITNTLLGENPQPPVDLSTRTIVFDVSLQQPLADLAIPVGVDLAIPGLDLDVDGRVKVQAGARFDLRIGVDRNDGVFLDTSRPARRQR
jgi:hypothetical protein